MIGGRAAAQVRNMMGAILDVGGGRIDADRVRIADEPRPSMPS